MKKLILLFFSLLSVNFLSAQLSQGNQQAGGVFLLSLGSENGGDIATTSFILIPSYAYFLQDNLAIGAGAGFSISRRDNENTNTENNRFSFILNPFVRYHLPINDNFFLFGQADLMIAPGNTRNEQRIGNTTVLNEAATFDFRIGLIPGVLWMVGENFGLEAGIGFVGYQSKSRKPDEADNWNSEERSFEIRIDPRNVNFGLRYYF